MQFLSYSFNVYICNFSWISFHDRIAQHVVDKLKENGKLKSHKSSGATERERHAALVILVSSLFLLNVGDLSTYELNLLVKNVIYAYSFFALLYFKTAWGLVFLLGNPLIKSTLES